MATEKQIQMLNDLRNQAIVASEKNLSSEKQPVAQESIEWAKEGMPVWSQLIACMSFENLSNDQVSTMKNALTSEWSNLNPVRQACIEAMRDEKLAAALGISDLRTQIQQVWTKGVNVVDVADQIFPVEAIKEETPVTYSDGLTTPSFRDVEKYLVEIGAEDEWEIIGREDLETETSRMEMRLAWDIKDVRLHERLMESYIDADSLRAYWSKTYSVSQAADMAGVSARYVQAEIKAKRLKAELVQPEAGRSYYAIKPDDFETWRTNPQRGQRGNRAKKADA